MVGFCLYEKRDFKSIVLLSVFALGATSSSMVSAKDDVKLLNKGSNSKVNTESLVNIGGVNDDTFVCGGDVESKLNDSLGENKEKIIQQHGKNEAIQESKGKENNFTFTEYGSKIDSKYEANGTKKLQGIANAGKVGLFGAMVGLSSAGVKKLVDCIKNGTKLKSSQSTEGADTDADIDYSQDQKTESKDPSKSTNNYIKIPVCVIISIVVLLILGFGINWLRFYIWRCKLKSKIIKAIPDIDRRKLTKEVLDALLGRESLWCHYSNAGLFVDILIKKPNHLKNILDSEDVVDSILDLIFIFGYIKNKNINNEEAIMEALLSLDMDQIKILFDRKFINQFELIIKNKNAVNIINAIASVNREKVTLFFNSEYKKLVKYESEEFEKFELGKKVEDSLSALKLIFSEEYTGILKNILKKDNADKIISSLLNFVRCSQTYQSFKAFFDSLFKEILNIDDSKLPLVIDVFQNLSFSKTLSLLYETHLNFSIAILFGKYGEKQELILDVKTPIVTWENNKEVKKDNGTFKFGQDPYKNLQELFKDIGEGGGDEVDQRVKDVSDAYNKYLKDNTQQFLLNNSKDIIKI